MAVQFPCLVCNRDFAKNHRAVQCDLCDSWVHIACNNLNVYTYRKLQKDKSHWYYIFCFRKELPYGSTNDAQLKNYCMERLPFLQIQKIISSVVKQSEYLDEELLSNVNNKSYTPYEFNNALKNLNMHLSFFFMQTLIYPLFLVPILNCII